MLHYPVNGNYHVVGEFQIDTGRITIWQWSETLGWKWSVTGDTRGMPRHSQHSATQHLSLLKPIAQYYWLEKWLKCYASIVHKPLDVWLMKGAANGLDAFSQFLIAASDTSLTAHGVSPRTMSKRNNKCRGLFLMIWQPIRESAEFQSWVNKVAACSFKKMIHAKSG